MIITNSLEKASKAGKISFLNSGIGIAPWAATMPYVIERLNLSQSLYTVLLLAFGIGSVTGMPATGFFIRHFGVRPVLSLAFIALFTAMIAAASPVIDFIPLVFFSYLWGAGLGITEVANNVHATYFEEISKRDLLSNFHAYQTLGAIIMAICYPVLLYMGIELFYVSSLMSIFGLILLVYAHKRLLNTHGQKTTENHSIGHLNFGTFMITLAGITCALMFLSEGLIYDWSGIYLLKKCSVPLELDSLGYVVFQICVASMRFAGAFFIRILGKLKLLVSGSILSMLSLYLCSVSDNACIVICLFALTGIGLANVVPIVISEVAKKCSKDKAKAIAIVGTIGYSGVLFGPAVLGLISILCSLEGIFVMASALMLILALISKPVLKQDK